VFDWENDPIVQELEERRNIDLTFITAPWTENGTKINLLLSTGEDVDIITTVGDIPKWQQEEAIVALDPYITEETHPYIYKIVNSQTFSPMQIDGQAWAIPQVPLGVAWGTMVRQDWLDAAGLGMPTNDQELLEALRAMRDMDPTGTTTGFQFEGSNQIRRTTIPIMSMFGVPSSFWDQHVNFVIENDTLTHIATMDNTKDALEYMNMLYNEGLINRDFPSMNSFPQLTEKYILSSKAGMGWVINPFVTQARNLAQTFPEADVSVLMPLSARGHEFTRAQGIMMQGTAVVTSASDTPQVAVDLLEYFNSYEGRKLMLAGLEGVHYENLTSDGYFDRIEDNWDYEWIYFDLNFYLGQGNCEGYIPAADYDTFEEAYANSVAFVPSSMRDEANVKVEYEHGALWFGAPNPLQFVQFPEENDLKNAVSDAIVEGWTKCIAAAPGEFEAEWRAHQAELQRVGLDRWVALYQGYYDQHIK
jgi:ABC-type glycerol-3-phosphate transport system substrate-binding protein